MRNAGVRRFDGSTGGVGGCPYAKGATGNVALEKIAYIFHRQGRRREFLREATQTTLEDLKHHLGLSLHSSIADILQKGGDLYEN